MCHKNMHSICRNILAARASSLSVDTIFSRDFGSYQEFLDKGLLLTRKLPNQWFLVVILKSSLRKFYGRHHDLVDDVSGSQMTTDMFRLS